MFVSADMFIASAFSFSVVCHGPTYLLYTWDTQTPDYGPYKKKKEEKNFTKLVFAFFFGSLNTSSLNISSRFRKHSW